MEKELGEVVGRTVSEAAMTQKPFVLDLVT